MRYVTSLFSLLSFMLFRPVNFPAYSQSDLTDRLRKVRPPALARRKGNRGVVGVLHPLRDLSRCDDYGRSICPFEW